MTDFKQTYKHLHTVQELNASCLAILWLVHAKFIILCLNLKQDMQLISGFVVKDTTVYVKLDVIFLDQKTTCFGR